METFVLSVSIMVQKTQNLLKRLDNLDWSLATFTESHRSELVTGFHKIEQHRQWVHNHKFICFQVADLGQGRQIVRVKNCSGWTEPMWCGSWSPDDTNWANVSESIRRELDGEAFHDGGFWIGFQDFLKYFDTIDFCHINHEVDKEVVFNGRWEVGLNAGGVQKGDFKNYAKNPQCFIELRSPNSEVQLFELEYQPMRTKNRLDLTNHR